MRVLLMHICIMYEKNYYSYYYYILSSFFCAKNCMKNKVQSTIHADTSKNLKKLPFEF